MVAIFRTAARPLFSLPSLPFPPRHRKSFEYEDAARMTAKQGTLGGEARHSGLYHAYSDDNIYEDIVCKSDVCGADFVNELPELLIITLAVWLSCILNRFT